MTPLALMDTTLRDGEQTPNLSFSPEEKLEIASLLLCEVCVDRIEVGSARVSAGERRAASLIAHWARQSGLLDRVEMLGFCDGSSSAEWIWETGIRRVNLLVKGSEPHCRLQLGMNREGHLAQIEATLDALRDAGLTLSGVYLEDWSRGMAGSPDYVLSMIRDLRQLGVERLYLADTLGVLEPDTVFRYVRSLKQEFQGIAFEFHAHDDYGLATANCLAAARAGIDGLHTTVNGLGERAGNACLEQVVVALRDHAGRPARAEEAGLWALSRRVALAGGCTVAHNAPVVGEHVFTQTAGIHADGDRKARLYCSTLGAERFGRRREYALGKFSGRASLAHHLRQLGVELPPAHFAALLARVVEAGDQKRRVGADDLRAWLASAEVL